MKFDIIRATAIYSGGNIYLYYAELSDGNWLMGCEEWLTVVNENPLASEEIFEESSYAEWQEERLVREIPEEDFQAVLNQILDAIFEGKTIKGWDNFCIAELKSRYAS